MQPKKQAGKPKTTTVVKPKAVEQKAKVPQAVKPSPQKNIPQKKIENVPVKKQEEKFVMESTEMPLGGLAAVLDGKDRRCIYLVDPVGNSYTFFKYKGRLIDLADLHIQLHVKGKNKEEINETIRKHICHGLKNGEAIVFHVANAELNVDQFLKDAEFWNPKKLFQRPQSFDQDWYRKYVVKPTDTDSFGNQANVFYANNDFQIFVSTSADVPFEKLQFLKGCEKEFRKIKII